MEVTYKFVNESMIVNELLAMVVINKKNGCWIGNNEYTLI
jgi:hypothetical protein